MYFGGTPFAASPFGDPGFNPNAFVNVTGSRINETKITLKINYHYHHHSFCSCNGKGYCYKKTKESIMRMETMVSTNDGFIIAEKDLEIRGPGNLMGTQQSGEIPLKITNLIKDYKLISKVRLLVSDILKKDPNLKSKGNHIISKNLKNIFDKKEIWEYIS